MKKLFDTINEYNKWKDSIREVLRENFEDIAKLIIDAYGIDFLAMMNKPPSGISLPTMTHGVVVNRLPNTDVLHIWYYENSTFYLLEKNKDESLLNIGPIANHGFGGSWVNGVPAYRARFENEVNFVVMLMEWSDNLTEVLLNRMKEIDPGKADEVIRRLTSCVK